MKKLEEYKVVEKIFEHGRWWAILDEPYNGRRRIANAIYVWLLGNPSFLDMPKGYVVHHLDHDEINDDISNLVIMQKHHHVAHHWKSKKLYPEIPLSCSSYEDFTFDPQPTRKPRIYQCNRNKKWYLQFPEYKTGKRVLKKLRRFQGEVIPTREAALKIRKMIWDDHPRSEMAKPYIDPNGEYKNATI